MLATTLQRLIDLNLTTAKELSELSGVSTSTVYRWLNGESQPEFDSIRLIVRHLKDQQAQEHLLSVFTAGTSWQLVYADHALDVNEDGRIDAQDALDACIHAVKSSADSLQHIRESIRGGQRLSAEQIVEALAHLNEVSQASHVTQRVLVKLNEGRRSARVRLAE